ncbi:uncharacterized protein At1g27050 [Dendrobium catenatum]|uniref:RRM domain-containing protein n=1 Tax=Dendrobium catenatum TaxID=906689 RepID=A0A2I0VY47_9ASPA|nr:uncharacterized protein At1g27050 [Dendrobium catenatum]PKU68345.1 Uncharacterized protein MA16_Dca008826 [Dendrobium catenatum]
MERRSSKRGKPNLPSSLAKRIRLPPADGGAVELSASGQRGSSSSSPSAVMVTGLPSDCTVLELKSRFEMYGPISRTRIDENCFGYVTFRFDQAAEAAIAASIDPTFGIAIRTSKLQVVRASDPVTHWRIGVRSSSTSKLVRSERPLSRLGRSKKQIIPGTIAAKNGSESSYTEREIKAYDDLF